MRSQRSPSQAAILTAAGSYLKIDKSGAKRRTFMWVRKGRQREAGLGSVNAVPLAKARDIAASMRAQFADGRDPIEARQAHGPNATAARRSAMLLILS